MSARKCPYCGVRVSYWRSLTSGSMYFNCAACGNSLKEDWKRILIFVMVAWWPTNWVLVRADDDPRYILGVLPAIGLTLFIDYLLLRVLPVENKAA